MSTAPLNQLVEKVRTAHPGAYDDMDDAELTKRVLAKYPQYSDLAAPSALSSAARPAPMEEDRGAMPGGKLQGLPGTDFSRTPSGGEMAGDVALAAGPLAGIPAEGAAEAVAPAARAATRVMAKHPLLSMAGLAAAKKLPIIGPYLEHIPDWLPLLAGEGSAGAAGAKAEAEGVEAAAAKTAPAATAEAPAATAEAPAAALGKVPVKTVRQSTSLGPNAKVLSQAEALKQPVYDVVDQAIPPDGPMRGTNLLTKARIDHHLAQGDVEGAQAVLDQAKGPDFPPEASKVVPSVQNIRETDAQVQAAEAQPRRYGSADAAEDRALGQEMNWNLERHGFQAESEARREFIARNSTGMTKGELNRQFDAAAGKPPAPEKPVKYTKTPGVKAVDTNDDLLEKLQQSLEDARAKRR